MEKLKYWISLYFIDNKYTRLYLKIIQKRFDMPLIEKGHNHHIIPKCIDKTLIKEKFNLINLSFKEHYICHRLLSKMCKNSIHKGKMNMAMQRLLTSSNLENVRISPKLFSKISQDVILFKKELAKNPTYRERISKSQSIAQSKIETKNKKRNSLIEFYKKETRLEREIRINKIKNAIDNNEQKEKQLINHKNAMSNLNTRLKISKSKLGKKASVETKEKISIGQLKRWENMNSEEKDKAVSHLLELNNNPKHLEYLSSLMVEKWKDEDYKLKQRENHLKVVSSNEHKAKLSQIQINRFKDNKERLKLSNAMKGGKNPRAIKIIAYDDLGWESEIFLCMKDGYIWAKTNKKYIKECLAGTREFAGKHPLTKNKIRWKKI